jgi:hypothetical protein
MGAHGSKEKLSRSASERFVHAQVIERERFGSFGKRIKKEGNVLQLSFVELRHYTPHELTPLYKLWIIG